MRFRILIIAFLGVIGFLSGKGQDSAGTKIPDLGKLTGEYSETISKKSEKLSKDLEFQSQKYLTKLQKQEARLQKKLTKIDSLAANNIFSDSKAQYEKWQNSLRSKANGLLQRPGGQYLPWIDSASTSLKFLQNNQAAQSLTFASTQAKQALGKLHELESQFRNAENLKDFIRQRKEYLKSQLQQYKLGKGLEKYNKTAYYYAQQVNEYKATLDDPNKLEQKALGLVRQMPAFQNFFMEHSELAALFPNQGGSLSNPQSLAGLQTRDQVQQMIQSQISAAGPNAQGLIQQNIQAAQNALSQLKNKLSNSANGDLEDLPHFLPNSMKTKTFWKRLEYGTNFQTVKSGFYYPVSTDLGFSIGYRLSEKNVFGIGTSYKIGWGKDIQHISISSQGMSIRSFLDIKIKGSFMASGGFEYNYQQPFSSFQQINPLNNWSESGLLGITKIVSLKTKVFKKTKIQILWDFLSYQQRPITQPIKFRVGYSF